MACDNSMESRIYSSAKCRNHGVNLLRNMQREHTQAWMDEYNNNRPHEGLGNLTPTELSKNIRHKQQINQLVT
ncbi:integrase core domain-containing protein [Sphingobacterium multivorum]|uniref:integrase core domain-containing protein n=1 Tax=Sphingobacterium multivorum TaxID=28454 RepID=UPI0035E43BE3